MARGGRRGSHGGSAPDVPPAGSGFFEEATELAERLRIDTQEATLPIPTNITASFGVTLMLDGDTPESLIARADRALYEAKQSGRNAVRTISSEPS